MRAEKSDGTEKKRAYKARGSDSSLPRFSFAYEKSSRFIVASVRPSGLFERGGARQNDFPAIYMFRFFQFPGKGARQGASSANMGKQVNSSRCNSR